MVELSEDDIAGDTHVASLEETIKQLKLENRRLKWQVINFLNFHFFGKLEV